MLVIIPSGTYGSMLRYRRTKSGGIGRFWTSRRGIGGQIRAVSGEFGRLLKIGRAVSGRFGQFPTDKNISIFSYGRLRPFWAALDKS
ncbi:Uncharacterized protein APZ42_003737 [Daphnia magna]|uniref:Uncharacterized protein n=1 Tax=Daphnia magna TaxID=35525 RepID=A0A168EJ79_9CRUS|nr:Uncharacterized protein APZ42_003737 [Daphnia magna]